MSLIGLVGCGGSHSPLWTTSDAGAGSADPASTAAYPCSALKPLAERPVLGSWRTHYAYYSPDRSWLVLQVRGERDSLIRVELPSGRTTTIIEGLNYVLPLGKTGAFLLLGAGSAQEDILLYDGKDAPRLVGRGLCDFEPAPNGSRLYIIGACVGEENGLEAIDVATGEVSIVDKSATMATTWDIAVSPDGQWVAYGTGDSNRTIRTITLANVVAGSSYTITSAEVIDSLEFVSDELLVFKTAGTSAVDGDLRGHVPGSGDTSFLIASDVHGHRFSLDRTRVMVAKISRPVGSTLWASLYSVPSTGGDPLLLVKDWSSPYSDMGSPYSFDSRGKYALYVSLIGLDPVSYTVSAVDMQGSKPRKLSNDVGFAPTPATSSVLLFEADSAGRFRLRLTDIATGVDRLSFASQEEQVISIMALRGDQAVFFGTTDGEKDRARFMSARFPQSVVLGEWEEGHNRGAEPMPVEADPTGCFTVVNTDVAPGPGTRLVLLPE